MSFIVVLVGRPWAPDEPEGSICCENDCWIIDGSKVGKLDTFQIIIGLEVERISSKVGLPLWWNLIKSLGSQVGLNAVLDTWWFEGGFEVLSGGKEGLLKAASRVEDVEAESKS